MKCDEFQARLHDLLDQRLAPEDDDALRSHANNCDHCDHVLQAQERLFYGLAQFPAPTPSGEFAERLAASVVTTPRSRRSLARPLMILALGLAAAVAIAFLPRFSNTPTNVAKLPPTASPDAPVNAANELASSTNHSAANDASMESETARVFGNGQNEASQPPSDTALAASASNEVYRLWISEMATRMQTLSVDSTSPVEELASGFRPVANSISGAIGALRRTLPGIRPHESDAAEPPQAGLWRDGLLPV
ncbi:MAG: zf-HC2 domain-containing protein [Planctomycetales bacterium]|nr:zf-HC2 domain-containing protein [Planctomycetales bacterium]